jgi:hypothetical protein
MHGARFAQTKLTHRQKRFDYIVLIRIDDAAADIANRSSIGQSAPPRFASTSRLASTGHFQFGYVMPPSKASMNCKSTLQAKVVDRTPSTRPRTAAPPRPALPKLDCVIVIGIPKWVRCAIVVDLHHDLEIPEFVSVRHSSLLSVKRLTMSTAKTTTVSIVRLPTRHDDDHDRTSQGRG